MADSPHAETTDEHGGSGRERDTDEQSGESGDEGAPGKDLNALLDLGRQFLEASVGAVIRVDGGHSRVVASATGSRPEQVRIDQSAARETMETAGVVAHTDGADGETGWYLGHRITLDGQPRGVVCFTDDERRGVDEAERAIVGILARLVAVELSEATGANSAWTGQELTETLLDTVPDLLYAFSADGSIVQWNDEMETVTGYDTDEIATMGALDFFEGDDRSRVAAAVTGTDPGESATVEADLVTADGEHVPYQFHGAPITSDGDVVGFAGVGRDVSEHREYEETLTELHDVTRELLPLETESAICERVVTAATELLDITVVGLFLFDDDENVLRAAARNDGADEVVDETPDFAPGEGIAWEAFMRGEIAVYDDVREADAVYNPETAIRSELFVPLGEHGILLAGSTATAAFDDRTVELADLLAANAEAALDNVARKRDLADRDAELEHQHRRLQRLNEVNERVRRIGHALVGADTADEIATLVCERLTAADQFAFVGLTDGAGEVRLRAQAGRDAGYVDAVRGIGTERDEAPLWRAERTGEPTVVDRVADDFHGESWRREALSRDFRAVAAFPLDHDGVPRGTLAVYADAAEAFDAETVTVLGELADMVAEAMGVAQRQRAAAADEQIEVVVGLDPEPCPVGTFAGRVDAPVTVTRAIPQSGGDCLVYGTAAADADAVTAAIAATQEIRDGRVVADTDDGVRFEVTTGGRTIADSVRRFGGTCDRVEIERGAASARLRARLPPTGDVREFVSLLDGDYDDVELLVQRTVPRPTGEDPFDALTDRQREALVAAYDAGFFEWPRESAGEEVASDLSVSQPTFVEHLRRAQSNLLESLLDE